MNAVNFDEKAALAEAAYADFSYLKYNDKEGKYNDDDVLTLLTSGKLYNGFFSQSQAKEFVRDWKVVRHTPNTQSGYSATLFESKKEAGSFFYAVRGTEVGLNDLVKADIGDIVGNGVAIDQVIDMYNDWKRLVTDKDKSFQAVRLTELAEETAALRLISVGPVSLFYDYQQKLLARGDIVIQGVGALASVRRIEFDSSENILPADKSKGLGVLAANQKVNAVGHSLGGHLAFSFSRLFGASNQIETTALNGAGFANGWRKGLGGNAAGNIENLFGTLGGAAGFNAGAIQNFYGSAGPNIITMDSKLGLQQPGRHTEIFTESAGLGVTFGHGVGQLVDSLSVMDLFLTMDAALSAMGVKAWTAKLNAIFEAASVEDDAALEAVLDAWGGLLISDYNRLGGATEEREELYSRIKSIRSVIDSKKADIVSLVGMTPSEIASLANSSGGEAYRLALLKLSPFAIVGMDYSSQSHLVSLYDSQTGQGVLTSEWLSARAELLSERLKASAMDVNAIDRARALSLYLRGAFADEKPAIDPFNLFGSSIDDSLSVGSTLDAGGHLFGEDGSDVLVGRAKDDYLEGGSGNDKLEGNDGADWLRGMQDNDTLIGGRGNDLLEGGAGDDIYEFKSGDGLDRIKDVDGKIFIDGSPIPSLKQVSPGANVWSDEKKTVFVTLIDDAQGVRQLLIDYGVGDRVLIESFKDGAFGLSLPTVEFPQKTDAVLRSEYIGDGSLDRPRYDSNSNSKPEWNSYDKLMVWARWDGEGVVKETESGELHGFTGNDTLIGNLKDDVLIGGADHDYLYGFEGNDFLIADDFESVSEILKQSEGGTSHFLGDALDGGAGDDLLIGSKGQDLLLGGGGIDHLYGGDGDDVLMASVSFWSVLDGAYEDWGVAYRKEGSADERDLYYQVYLDGYSYNPFYYHGDYNALVQGKYDVNERDVLIGGAGNDWLFGSAGANFLDGGQDNDVAIGKEGKDTLLGGAGDDVLVGDDELKSSPDNLHGDDFLDGGADNDRLVGGGASDVLLGGAGEDTLIGDGINDAYRVSLQFHGGDYLDGGSDKDLLIGGGGADTLLGGSGDDEIQGDGTGVDRTFSGDDFLEGGSGNDRIFGNDGNDSLYGGTDNDTLWGDGQSGQVGDDYLDGGEGNDQLLGGAGADKIFGGIGNDILWGDEDPNSSPAGSDYLDGGLGSDTLYGGGGDDTLLGGAGEDIIQGNAGNNLFDGGTGDDRLFGENGNDIYLFNIGYGVDRLTDKGGANVIRFGPGVAIDSLAISVSKNAQGDVLSLQVGSDNIRLLNTSTWSGSKFVFSNGDSYSYEQILLKLPQAIQQQVSSSLDPSSMFGSFYNDSLTGGDNNDTLKGQGGNDTLVGGKGDDTYLFNVGDGQDLIRDTEGSNVISFGADISSSSLTFSTGFSAEGESYLKVGYGDDFVMIESGLWGAIKAFEFADGTLLSFADAMRRADNLVLVLPDEASTVYGSDQADRIYGGLGDDAIDAQGGGDQVSGGAGSDTLEGGEGNDELAGDQGDDQLLGGSGNDQLLGGEGNDLLKGGEGNDWLSGGAGQDILNGGTGINTYVFERGMGFDLIELTEGESAILKIGSDIFRQDLVSRQDGKDLLLEVKGSQDGARLKDYFSASRDWKVDTGAGSLVDLTTFLTATSSGYSMTADEAERVFRQQVLTVFKERMDTINAQAQADGTYRTHSVSESVSSRVDSYSNYSLVFSEEAVSSVVRSENRYAYRSTSEAKDSRSIRLSSGSDTLYGSGDFISFSQLSKMLNGRFGGLQADGCVPVFKYNKNTGAEELIGWQVTSGVDTGLSAKKTFTTTNIDNSYVNKVVRGDASNRNVVVGLGNIYRGGEGNEQLYGEDLNYANSSAGVFLDGGAGNDYLAGSRKSDFLVSGLGNDTLEGDAGSDTYIISKGEGVSVISDSFRSIKYIGYDPDRLLDGYHRGYSEFTPDESEKNDIVVLPEGVSLTDLKLAWGRIQHEVYVKNAVLYDPTRRYGATKGIAGAAKGIMAVTTLDLSWSDNQKIRIVMPFQHDPIGSGIDKIQFADGTVLTLEQLRSNLGLEAMPDSYVMDQRLSRSDMDGLHLQRADGPDSVLGAAGGYLSPYAKIAMPLVGGSGSDTLSGGGALWGGDGNDSLLGDTGADDLIGGFGADTLIGGEGDDRLGASLDDFYGEGNLYQGGRGKDDLFGTLATDTYIYDRGDGADRIIDLYAPGYSNTQLYYNGSAQAILDNKVVNPFSPLLLSRQTMSWRSQYDSDAPYYKGLDTIRFGKGISQGDLGFELEGSDLVIRVAGSDGDSLRFVNWSLFASKPLGRIAFADGTVLEGDALSERIPKVLVLSGTDGSDYFGDYPSLWVDYVAHGQGGNDTLQGTFGNNTFYGDQGNDRLESGRGNDYLNGGEGDDTLKGSVGNDTLEGGAGNDMYAFSRYSLKQGVTRILDTDKAGRVQFDGKDIDATKVETVARNRWRALDGSYLLTFDDVNAELLLQAVDTDGTLLAGKVVVSSFANGDLGLLLPDLEVATQVPPVLKALPEQTLTSGQEWSYLLSADSFFPQGNQALVYSAMLKDGSALPGWLEIDAATGTIYGNAPGVGSLSLIVQAMDAQGRRVRQSLDMNIEVNHIAAIDGEHVLGSSGDDYISGTSASNQLSGGLGNDVLDSGEGADQLDGNAGDDQLLGGAGDDLLQDDTGNNLFDAGAGDDVVFGGKGDDTFRFNLGDGVDQMMDTGGKNTIVFGPGFNVDEISFAIQNSEQGSYIRLAVGSDALLLSRLGDWRNTSFVFSNGDSLSYKDIESRLTDADGGTHDFLVGGLGSDILFGGLGNDTLLGSAGADWLLGGKGNDTYRYSTGITTIEEEGGQDSLVFSKDVSFAKVVSGALKWGNDLVLRLGGESDYIVLSSYFLGGDNLIETIAFETGELITAEQVFTAFGVTMPTADSIQKVNGTTANDGTLQGGEGADLIRGYAGDDTLLGSGGDDNLQGGDGHDLLDGGAGSDLLSGGRGNDVYIFKPGAGQDVIDNRGGGYDTLRLEGISLDQASKGARKFGDDLLIDLGSDKLTLKGFFLGGDYAIGNLVFGSGEQLTAAQIYAAFGRANPDPIATPLYQGLPDEQAYDVAYLGQAGNQVMIGSSGRDLLDGGSGNDTLRGGAGDDYVMGGNGSDIYKFGLNDGRDVINNKSTSAAEDVDVLEVAGSAIERLWLSRENDNLIIDLLGSSDRVTVQDWYSSEDFRLDVIKAGDYVLYANQTEALVNAMASFAPPVAGEVNITQVQREQLNAVIVANWQ